MLALHIEGSLRRQRGSTRVEMGCVDATAMSCRLASLQRKHTYHTTPRFESQRRASGCFVLEGCQARLSDTLRAGSDMPRASTVVLPASRGTCMRPPWCIPARRLCVFSLLHMVVIPFDCSTGSPRPKLSGRAQRLPTVERRSPRRTAQEQRSNSFGLFYVAPGCSEPRLGSPLAQPPNRREQL